jgi:hypothetical protein
MEILNSLDPVELNKFFLNARPFPFVVIDDFFREDFFRKLCSEMNEYYENKKNEGLRYSTEVESNKWGSTGLGLPEHLVQVEELLSSKKFQLFLEGVSGFKDLKTTADTNGVGYSFFHLMPPGSYLGPHTDHTRDMASGIGSYHVLNIIIYCQGSWNANWLGGTAFYESPSKIGSIVEYKPNRAVVFMHSPISIHGTQIVPKTANLNRLSLYYDYYTDDASPYRHLQMSSFPLIKSGHRFYLKNVTDYLKPENKKYLIGHLSHFKRLLEFKLFNKI